MGAYTPDWQSLISNDAAFKDAAATLAAGNAQNQTQLNSEIANAYEAFAPNSPDLAALAQSLGMTQADLQNIITPDVQKLAQENTAAGTSTSARLDQANQKATAQIIANLNKRGLLHSGEASYQLDQQNLGYRQAQSDAYQKLLGYLQQYQQGYLSAQQANAQKLADAYSSAGDRVLTENSSTAGVTAVPDHQDATGAWVYRGPDGQFYDANGKPYVAPNPVAAMSGNPYGASLRPGSGNLYGSLDPALAAALVNHAYGVYGAVAE